MKISYKNYDKYIIDYIEGNLSKALHAEMELFISANPEIQSEISNFKDYTLKPDSCAHFYDKDLLKKSEFDYKNDKHLFTQYCVAKLEHDLDEFELDEFNRFLHSNPLGKYEDTLFQKTKLYAESVYFPDKKKLKKIGLRLIKIKHVVYSSVALIILSLILPIILQKTNPKVVLENYHQDINSTKERNISSYFVLSSKIIRYSQQHTAAKQNKVIIDSLTSQVQKTKKVYIEKQKVKSGEDVFASHDTLLNFTTIESPRKNNIFVDSMFIDKQKIGHSVIDTCIASNEFNTEQFVTLKQHLARKVSERIPIDLRKSSSIKKTHLFDFVKVGIKGYNAIFNKDVVVEQEFGKNGKRKMLAIKTDKFQIIKYY